MNAEYVVLVAAGLAYLLIGRLFAAPTTHVHAWRLAAWVVSAIVFAAHISYEQFRVHQRPRRTALYAALAVALGALALAVAGAVHSLQAGATNRGLWRVAFIVWPLVTGIPAFLAALLVATVLARFSRHVQSR